MKKNKAYIKTTFRKQKEHKRTQQNKEYIKQIKKIKRNKDTSRQLKNR